MTSGMKDKFSLSVKKGDERRELIRTLMFRKGPGCFPEYERELREKTTQELRALAEKP